MTPGQHAVSCIMGKRLLQQHPLISMAWFWGVHLTDMLPILGVRRLFTFVSHWAWSARSLPIIHCVHVGLKREYAQAGQGCYSEGVPH